MAEMLWRSVHEYLFIYSTPCYLCYAYVSQCKTASCHNYVLFLFQHKLNEPHLIWLFRIVYETRYYIYMKSKLLISYHTSSMFGHLFSQRKEQMHIFSLQDSVDVGMLANPLSGQSLFHIRRAALQNQNQTQVYSCYSHQFPVTNKYYFCSKSEDSFIQPPCTCCTNQSLI